MKESKRDCFYTLPLWLQRDILREEAGLDEWRIDKWKHHIGVIEQKCLLRGYGLNPTRGDMAFPPARRSRRMVGDFSILEGD